MNHKLVLVLIFFTSIFSKEAIHYSHSGYFDLGTIHRLTDGSIIKIPYRIVKYEPVLSYKNFNAVANTALEFRLKDIDNMFRIVNDAYYLEAKSSLDLDTEKGPATIEKVEAITESLRESGKYFEVVGKVISPFWEYAENIPIGGAIKSYMKRGGVMFFKEFSELLDLGLTKETYEALCKELGKDL